MNSKPFVNPITISDDVINRLSRTWDPQPARKVAAVGQQLDARTVNVLSSDEVEAIQRAIDGQPWQPVGLNGIADDYDAGRGDQIGSYRASCFSEPLAEILWSRLTPLFPAIRTMDDSTPTDWDGHRRWQPIAINPLLRFIRYLPGGLLVPHYDAPYDYGDDRRRTLTTVVIYLQDEAIGGATRFLRDPQIELPLADRRYDDWTRLAAEQEVTARVQPEPGTALLFDHRVLHDSEPLAAGHKTIIRTDVIYERVS
jgi:hypothetical protein